MLNPISIFIFIIIFGSAIKPVDDEGISVLLPITIVNIATFANYAIVVSVVSILFIMRDKKAEIKSRYVYLAVMSFLIFRLSIVITEIRSELWQKYLQSFIITFFTIFALIKINSLKFNYKSSHIVQNAIILWGLTSTAIAIYFILFRPEYGFHAGRFYGFFAHPNFAAISHAICGLTFLSVSMSKDKLFSIKAIATILFLLNCYIIISTGSRTGFIALAGGYSIIAISQVIKKDYASVFSALCVMFILYFLVTTTGGDALTSGLDRLTFGENTRVDVWRYMFNAFASSPIYGVGLGATDTAGSYIRALAAGGFILGATIVVFVILTIFCIFNCNLHNERNALYCSLIFSVILSGLTEGVLLEAIGLPLTIVCLSITALD